MQSQWDNVLDNVERITRKVKRQSIIRELSIMAVGAFGSQSLLGLIWSFSLLQRLTLWFLVFVPFGTIILVLVLIKQRHSLDKKLVGLIAITIVVGWLMTISLAYMNFF